MGKYLKSNNTVNHRGLWVIFKCIKNTEYYWGSSTPSFLGYSPINCSKYYHLLFLHKNIDIIQHGSEEVLCFLVNISYNLSSTQVTQRRKKDKNYKTAQISPTQSLELPFPQCLWSRDSSVRGSHPPVPTPVVQTRKLRFRDGQFARTDTTSMQWDQHLNFAPYGKSFSLYSVFFHRKGHRPDFVPRKDQLRICLVMKTIKRFLYLEKKVVK